MDYIYLLLCWAYLSRSSHCGALLVFFLQLGKTKIQASGWMNLWEKLAPAYYLSPLAVPLLSRNHVTSPHILEVRVQINNAKWWISVK